MPPWFIVPPVTPSPDLLAVADGHPLIARLLAQRGIDTPEKALPFLDPSHYQPAPPTALLGVAEAAGILHAAISRGSRFLIWGDFDVDGQTSTSLLVTALRALAGDEAVHFHVPNRFLESHGIKVDKLRAELDAAAEAGTQIDVLVSCDTGIAEGEAVSFAKARGLAVVITDHHDLSSEFQGLVAGVDPLWGLSATEAGANSVRRADAVVNPKFLPPGDPLRTLPGVGVAYKLVQQLYTLAGRAGEEEELLDLVALGIVADVAEQVYDARYLLQRGLARLRATRRVGLLALMNISRVDPAALTADTIGYQLGPRMNALGRLEDATVSVELLTTRDAIRAGQLAAKLERLNQERRLLTSQTTRAANEMIERDPSLLNYNALVLAHPNWHAGVVGIVASKLVEQFGKPTVLLINPPGSQASGEETPLARGSARSVPGVDIGAAIAACSRLLFSHGGHSGAAGLMLPPENIDAFRRELSRQVEVYRDESVQVGLQIDVETNLDELSLMLAGDLAQLAPFGSGNPTPQFVTYNLTVTDDRRIGREGTHRKLIVRQEGTAGEALPVVWFGGADAELPAGPIDLVYTLSVNEYKGERTLQLMYVDSRPAQAPAAVTSSPIRPALNVIDLRRADPAQLATELPPPDTAVWYAEGVRLENLPDGLKYAPRWQLASDCPIEHDNDMGVGKPLVLWSIPPSPELLRWLLNTVHPSTVYLCAQYTADDMLSALLRAVAGMCKYALNHPHQVTPPLASDQPVVPETTGAPPASPSPSPAPAAPQTAAPQATSLLDINRMAARLGVTESIVRHALLWLEARGEIYLIAWQAGDIVRIAAGEGQPRRDQLQQLEEEIEDLLAEVRAFRRFVQRARLADLNLQLDAKT
jgi:single-stranded-DNA-specific exonuclease